MAASCLLKRKLALNWDRELPGHQRAVAKAEINVGLATVVSVFISMPAYA